MFFFVICTRYSVYLASFFSSPFLYDMSFTSSRRLYITTSSHPSLHHLFSLLYFSFIFLLYISSPLCTRHLSTFIVSRSGSPYQRPRLRLEPTVRPIDLQSKM